MQSETNAHKQIGDQAYLDTLASQLPMRKYAVPEEDFPKPLMGQTWLTLKEVEQGENWKIKMDYIPQMCQHCENPVCAEGAPEGAVYKRADGIVIIDPVKAKGYKDLPQVFITGEVLLSDHLEDCCQGASVICRNTATGTTMETSTNCFGDFEFKHLSKDASYEITCSYDGYKSVSIPVQADRAKDLKEIILEK